MKFYILMVFITLIIATTTIAQDTSQWHLPDGAKRRLGKGEIGEIDYSPDGTKLAVASGIGIWIYDTQTGEELNFLKAPLMKSEETPWLFRIYSAINTIAFCPDGKTLISDIDGNDIGIWDVDTGTLLRKIITTHRWPLTCVAISPNGKIIASGGYGTSIRLFDVETGKERNKYIDSRSTITNLVFSPDGDKLAATSFDDYFYVWHGHTGRSTQTFRGHTDSVNSVTFHPNGKTIVSGSSDKTIQHWDLETGTVLRKRWNQPDRVRHVLFSPDGLTVASSFDDDTTELDHAKGYPSSRTLRGHTHTITSIAFSPDSQTFASASRDGTVRLWDVYTGRERLTITGHIDRIWTAAFSPDGNTIVGGGYDSNLHLWNAHTGFRQQVFTGHSDYINSVAFSPDSKIIASGSNDGSLRLWDADNGLELHTLISIEGDVKSVAFTPDGKIVACAITLGSYNSRPYLRGSNVYLFDVETGRILRTIAAYVVPDPLPVNIDRWFRPTQHTRAVYNIAFTQDGKMLATESTDDTIRLWNVNTGEHLSVLSERTFCDSNLVSSPDGYTVSCAGYKNVINLWDIQSGERKQIYTDRSSDVLSIAFSPDGNTIAAGGDDYTIHLLDINSGTQLRILRGHINNVNSVAFSQDGNTLASSSSDGTILLWDVTPTEPINTTVSLAPLSVESPVVGQYLTLSINIAMGQNVAGYQATIHFDNTALRYIESSNGDYLSETAFVIEPVFYQDKVTLATVSLSDESNDDGILVTITFEVLSTHASVVTLSDVLLTDLTGDSVKPNVIGLTEITEPMFLPEDVNEDGVVNILDLTAVSLNFGRTGKNNADINRDGVVNIVDLALVAAAIDNDDAAPGAWFTDLKNAPTRTEVEVWLREAQKLYLEGPTIQRGIAILEQVLDALTPKQTMLLPNYPNPFNPETWIPYQLSSPADVRITIYSANGELIRLLDVGYQEVGIYQHRSQAAYWDGKNLHDEPVASGIYFYTLNADQFSTTRKMLIQK